MLRFIIRLLGYLRGQPRGSQNVSSPQSPSENINIHTITEKEGREALPVDGELGTSGCVGVFRVLQGARGFSGHGQ